MLRADDRVSLQHMVDAGQRAMRMAAGHCVEDLESNDALCLALQRLIEIIGEAAKRVSIGTRALYPSIAWGQAAGMRDRIIHRYYDVNLQIVWDTIVDDLPTHVSQIEEILRQDESGRAD